MPYIKPETRTHLEQMLKCMHLTDIRDAGELNYLITCLVQTYVVNRRAGVNYQGFNDALGALEGAKLELYRRGIGPYEDRKISENGDVLDEKLKPVIRAGGLIDASDDEQSGG